MLLSLSAKIIVDASFHSSFSSCIRTKPSLSNDLNRITNKLPETHLLDVIITQRPSILELLASEYQPLLVRRNPFFVLNLGLDVVDGVAGLDLEGDGFARESLDEAVSC